MRFYLVLYFPLIKDRCLLSWQVSSVIHETRALDINTQVLFPLGETAAAIRGENELWLAMVLRNKILLDLKPAELAAVCGGLVSEGIKVRPSKDSRYFKVLAPLSLGSLEIGLHILQLAPWHPCHNCMVQYSQITFKCTLKFKGFCVVY